MIKAIIFDCFGVLVGDVLPDFATKYFADDAETTVQLWEYDDLVNKGKMTVSEFFTWLGAKSGLTEQEVAKELDKHTCNQELFDYIRDRLNPAYKIGILSNMAYDMLDDLMGRENRSLFDAEILSFAEGIVKPDERLYLKATERLNVLAGECLFIDDKERYCDGARAIGMQAMQYTNFEELKKRVDEVL